MDFFQAQEDARRRTKVLAFYFVLCVLGVVAAVEVLLFFLLGAGAKIGGGELVMALLVGGVGTLGVILLGSLFKTISLRKGGAVVANDLGGRLVIPGTGDADERRLLNVVEEMAIASGTPVPQVYMMDGEEGINAFAAGTEPSNAVIGVTRGCVQRLSRAELQGVIAHEFSHILNGDMRLNMRLMGMVFGLVIITVLGRSIISIFRFAGHGRRSNNKDGMAAILVIFLVGLVLMIVGSIGTFFARMLQAAVSRQREYLADASAVQFTREPDGIAGALKKIGGQQHGSKLVSPKAMEASHMFFADGGMFAYGLATHPPLDVRIKAIQKSWDGEFVSSELPPVSIQGDPPPLPKARKGALGGVMMLDQIGEPAMVDVEQGRVLRDGLDEGWIAAAHDKNDAQALMFGLLVADDETLRAGELASLHGTAGPEAAVRAGMWQGELRGLHSARKIALIDVCIPTLRGMSDAEYRRFVGVTQQLIRSDGKVTLFEYMLHHLLRRHLASHFEELGFPKMKWRSLEDLAWDTNVILSAIAWLGRDADEAATTWESVVRNWPAGAWKPVMLKAEQCGPSLIGSSLEKFEASTPIVKKSLLELCARAAAQDGVLSSREGELLRMVADAIGCGVPPFVRDLDLG
ncbi:MAG: M48 family metallopeptidase [Akkermansiaceae bacterium]|nr:M48 family metallopeptidase [Akkermansiaceae bacterium]